MPYIGSRPPEEGTIIAGDGLSLSTQIDGSNVTRTIDLDFASQAEAETGTATDKPMNALRVSQTVNASTVTRNRIINGSMAVAQRGTSFTGGTANADDSYTLDRWYVLSEGNDSIDVTQNEAQAPGTGEYCIALDVETTGEKFGVAQIIEARNCAGLIGEAVTLSFQAKVSNARIDTVKAAIVAWSGTANGLTSDIVSTWNADGTTPTLIADATFENTPADLGVTTSWATYSVSASVDTANAKNIVVFIWSDDATNPQAGDFLYITDVQLEPGSTSAKFERRPYEIEVALCQRYYISTIAGLRFYSPATSINAENYVYWPVTMRIAPTVTGPSGGSGVRVASSALYNPSVNGVRFNVVSNSAGDTYYLGAGIAADAEL